MNMVSILRKGLFLGIMAVAVLVVSVAGNMSISQAGQFAPMAKGTFLYMNTRELVLDGEGEQVYFVMGKDNVLRMCSRDGKKVYSTYAEKYGDNAGIGYRITRITMKDSDKVFFEINADQGAHAKNAGYWIVGKYKGEWVPFIDLDTLAEYGYTVNEWHQIGTTVDENGDFILTSSHEYMPPGAQFGYELRHAKDFEANIFWDEDAEWFGVKRLL